ncbi:probable LRR receptor-like serine/threonine-protein kinase RKF3 [Selaginella moellendorffii]|nr:probable LRR receptor-like serine/threonine-protein kinase RKF3 [Selaginella moellendorffii]|eukprot:XP_024531072.1 probable LRR receptor-like serine/threonine-protein kinase RKF3 [Selaginella moellendorffii]
MSAYGRSRRLLLVAVAAAALLGFFSPARLLVLGQSSCPLDFSVTADEFAFARNDRDPGRQCLAVREELNLVIAAQLNRTQRFLFPAATASSCIQDFQASLQRQGVAPNITVRCSIDSQTLESGSTRCPNFTSVGDFTSATSSASIVNIQTNCRGNIGDGPSCSACTAAVVSSVSFRSNGSTCLDYAHIYAASIVNLDGPTDPGTVACMFFNQGSRGGEKREVWKIALIVVAGFLALSGTGVLAWLWWRKRCKDKSRRKLLEDRDSTLERSMHSNASLIRFDMHEMKAATRNFHRTTLIGQGGYGNVYKGVLKDGTVVALKRFKNCSPAGDEGFVHEMEMISSVRHKNLAPLLGWCIGSSRSEGHQRIIVYEFMSNGSLDDHLFGKFKKNLDWPTRQKIAIGTAKGLAYLHNGAQPAIIHRDIKGGNILLDSEFNAKVADFGLAKFAPEGMTHMTTGVAGTQGYVAPEYVLYNQLTDRSDVYSFGIVFLELLSGRKALVHTPASDTPVPIADWAWSVMKETRIVDILQQPMDKLGDEEVMESFILVALLCAHPQVAYRPSMAQVVKMLENDLAVPSMPERPIPLMVNAQELASTTGTSYSGSVPFYFSSSGELPR